MTTPRGEKEYTEWPNLKSERNSMEKRKGKIQLAFGGFRENDKIVFSRFWYQNVQEDLAAILIPKSV